MRIDGSEPARTAGRVLQIAEALTALEQSTETGLHARGSGKAQHGLPLPGRGLGRIQEPLALGGIDPDAVVRADLPVARGEAVVVRDLPAGNPRPTVAGDDAFHSPFCPFSSPVSIRHLELVLMAHTAPSFPVLLEFISALRADIVVLLGGCSLQRWLLSIRRAAAARRVPARPHDRGHLSTPAHQATGTGPTRRPLPPRG